VHSGRDNGVGSTTKNTSLYIYSQQVKVLVLFLEMCGFFGNIFWRGRWRGELNGKQALAPLIDGGENVVMS